MRHKKIKTEDQFDMVAARMELLIDAPAGSNEAKKLKSLTKLIIDYVVKEVNAGRKQSNTSYPRFYMNNFWRCYLSSWSPFYNIYANYI